MKTKYISLLIAFLMLLSVFSSCDISETSKETTASTTEALESTNISTAETLESTNVSTTETFESTTVSATETLEFTTETVAEPLEEITATSTIDSSKLDEIKTEITESEETEYIWDPEEPIYGYVDATEAETDLAEVDYSKFVFMPETVYIDSDKELSIHNYIEASEMLKAAEAHNGEKISVSSREEAVELLGRVIEGSVDNKCVVMVSVDFKWGYSAAYYVGMKYTETYNMYYISGENKDLLFYSALTFKYSTTESIIQLWEKFTKYSHINSITFYTVPVVNVIEDNTSVDYSKFVFSCNYNEFVAKYGTDYKKVESEEEFDEVLNYLLSIDPYIYIALECNADKVLSIFSNAERHAIHESDKSRFNVKIETTIDYFDADLIKEAAKDNETIEIQFINLAPVDE